MLNAIPRLADAQNSGPPAAGHGGFAQRHERRSQVLEAADKRLQTQAGRKKKEIEMESEEEELPCVRQRTSYARLREWVGCLRLKVNKAWVNEAVWCLFGDAESRKISQESAEMAEIKAFEKKEEAEIEEIKDLQKKEHRGCFWMCILNGFENCKAPAPRSLHPALVATESHDAIQIEEQEHEEQDEDMNLTGRCNSYQSPAVWFRYYKEPCNSYQSPAVWFRYYKEPTLWCCDTRTQDCNGCEREQKGRYAPCMDIPGWANSAGKTCAMVEDQNGAQISEKECSVKRSEGREGYEGRQRGGIRSPTSFAYDDYLPLGFKTFVLGEDVKMYPKPRTATRYGVNDGCELDRVSYMKGRDKPKEPFKVSCKVTAFQLHHQIFTVAWQKISLHRSLCFQADIHVAVQELSFGASVLTPGPIKAQRCGFVAKPWKQPLKEAFKAHNALIVESCGYAIPLSFTPKTTLYELRKSASSEWKDFSTNCAPEAKWLKLEGNGHPGCKHIGRKKLLAAIPCASARGAAVGQAVPPLEPVAFPQGVMVPSSYGMRCNKVLAVNRGVKPGMIKKNKFKFDAVHGIGFYDGHPLLDGLPAPKGYNHDRHTAAHPVCGTKGCWCCRRPKNKFKFDAVHGIGFYDGHPLLDGLPARVFDAMGSEQDGSATSSHWADKGTTGGQLRVARFSAAWRPDWVVKLELKCRIVGVFPDSATWRQLTKGEDSLRPAAGKQEGEESGAMPALVQVVSWIDAETPRVQSQLGDVAIFFDFASLRAVDRRADVSMDFAAHIMSIFQPEKIEKIIGFEHYLRDPALIGDASQIGMNVLLCHFGHWFVQSPNTVLQLVQALQKHCADTATDDVGHTASTFVMANFAAEAVSSGVKELRHIFIRFLIQWLRTGDHEQLYYACAALVHCHDLGPFREECKQALMMAQTDEDQCRLRALAAVCPEIWGTADRRIRHLSSVCPDLWIRPYLLPLQSSYWVYTGERWAFDRTWSRRCVRQVQQ
ncbi:hypothetical protein AK812_SmicGene10715 [Symbiodinium microadriaticum]|uniref:Uncharacterized protein n=1 Tax=Symbiodinium microadriaticum TaxID=2951 RepID=A0A1Q9EF53_SYMMI|nr:hypothetical protein AK812_SmicGene10715 [Symbiodinium microadriaticum]